MKVRYASTILIAGLIFFAGYAALFIAPDERTMHLIQRIFYFHVPSWMAMFTALSTAFIANIAYLATHKSKWDSWGVSAVEVGVVCCTIGLATGPLWAKPVWGIWWTWDARLTTTFILWLLYIAYLLLRGLLDDPALYSQATHLITETPSLAARPVGTAPASAVLGEVFNCGTTEWAHGLAAGDPFVTRITLNVLKRFGAV